MSEAFHLVALLVGALSQSSTDLPQASFQVGITIVERCHADPADRSSPLIICEKGRPHKSYRERVDKEPAGASSLVDRGEAVRLVIEY